MGPFRKLVIYIKELPAWVLLAVFLISAIFTTHALRQNNFEMVKLRNALYAADQSGQGVETALRKLRQHVYGHMNTNLSSGGNAINPPIQLKFTYDRLIKAEQARINQANDQIYRDAQAYCERNQPGKFRQVCFENYTDKRNVKARAIPTALYQFDFLSPTWSPDLAGWSLVVSVLLGLAFIISYIAERLTASKVRRQRRSKA